MVHPACPVLHGSPSCVNHLLSVTQKSGKKSPEAYRNSYAFASPAWNIFPVSSLRYIPRLFVLIRCTIRAFRISVPASPCTFRPPNRDVGLMTSERRQKYRVTPSHSLHFVRVPALCPCHSRKRALYRDLGSSSLGDRRLGYPHHRH